MRKRHASLIGFVLLLLLGVARCQDEDGISWQYDLDDARALAKEEGKPLFIVFR